MKIALIWAGSSVGRALLSKNDNRLKGIYRSPKALSQLCDLDVNFQLVKISSTLDMMNAISGCDTVITLINDTNPLSALRSLKDVVEACRLANIPQLIHLSSAAIYGSTPARAALVDSPGASLTWNSYSAGKQWQEDFLKKCKDLPTSVVIIRPGLIWGPGMAWLNTPANEIVRGEAWVADGDASCNLLNINFLTHSLYYLASNPTSGLSYVNLRDRESLTWTDYYSRIARLLQIEHYCIGKIPRSSGHPWKGNKGTARSIFPFGLGWSVLPLFLKRIIKNFVGLLPRKRLPSEVRIEALNPKYSISREAWELKTADGLPPSNALLKELQESYERSSDEDWSELNYLREWYCI
jgi:nucleoside-diphosphate-sugar epimerase